jgi:hypothetical protein
LPASVGDGDDQAADERFRLVGFGDAGDRWSAPRCRHRSKLHRLFDFGTLGVMNTTDFVASMPLFVSVKRMSAAPATTGV